MSEPTPDKRDNLRLALDAAALSPPGAQASATVRAEGEGRFEGPSHWSSTCPHTRFMASVTSSGAWRAAYSTSAALYTSLLDRRARRASRSIRLNTSSGIDTAVFIPRV